MAYLTATELAKELQLHPATIRNWEKVGKIRPVKRVRGERKKYDLNKILEDIGHKEKQKISIIYINTVLLENQKNLDKEIDVAKAFCAKHGMRYRLIVDNPFDEMLQDGISDLLETMLYDNVESIVITKESMFGFVGGRIIRKICEHRRIPIISIEKTAPSGVVKDYIFNNLLVAQKLYSQDTSLNRIDKDKVLQSFLHIGVNNGV